jgi:CRISP-associated protein Cas1
VLRTLGAQGIGVVMLPTRGRAEAICMTRLATGATALRHRQHLLHADPARRLALAGLVVRQKLLAQAAMLESAGLDAAGPRAGLGTLSQAADLNALRGVEGSAAERHFDQLARRLGPGWRFERRSRRPPRDPFNALLSLGYTLATEEAVRAALRRGLDTEVGFLHGMRGGRPSLALDLVEPARPAVDRWAMDLVATSAVAVRDFHDNDQDGCRLVSAARQRVYASWFGHAQKDVRAAMRPLMAALLVVLREGRQSAVDSDVEGDR